MPHSILTFKFHKSKINSEGFTLIELLVAIAIVAILATIGLVSYSGIQKGARDTKRKAEVNAIAKSIEQTFINGSYSGVNATNFTSGAIPVDPSTGKSVCGTTSSNPCQFTTGVNGAAGAVGVPAVGTTFTTFLVCGSLENATGGNSSSTTTLTYVAAGAPYYCVKNQQ